MTKCSITLSEIAQNITIKDNTIGDFIISKSGSVIFQPVEDYMINLVKTHKHSHTAEDLPDTIVYTENGKIKTEVLPELTYNVPIASSSTLGGLKIGDGLTADSYGKVSVSSDYIKKSDLATSTTTNISDTKVVGASVDYVDKNIPTTYVKTLPTNLVYTTDGVVADSIIPTNIARTTALDNKVNKTKTTTYYRTATRSQRWGNTNTYSYDVIGYIKNFTRNYTQISGSFDVVVTTSSAYYEHFEANLIFSKNSFNLNGNSLISNEQGQSGILINPVDEEKTAYAVAIVIGGYTNFDSCGYNIIANLPEMLKLYSDSTCTTEQNTNIYNTSQSNSGFGAIAKDNLAYSNIYWNTHNYLTVNDISNEPTNTSTDKVPSMSILNTMIDAVKDKIPDDYTTVLPVASTTSVGLVKIGNGILMNTVDNSISVKTDYLTSVPDATQYSKGIVQIGDGITLKDGVISVKTDFIEESELITTNNVSNVKDISKVATSLEYVDSLISNTSSTTIETKAPSLKLLSNEIATTKALIPTDFASSGHTHTYLNNALGVNGALTVYNTLNINYPEASKYTSSICVMNDNMTTGQTNNLLIGKNLSKYEFACLGYNYNTYDPFISFSFYNNNHILQVHNKYVKSTMPIQINDDNVLTTSNIATTTTDTNDDMVPSLKLFNDTLNTMNQNIANTYISSLPPDLVYTDKYGKISDTIIPSLSGTYAIKGHTHDSFQKLNIKESLTVKDNNVLTTNEISTDATSKDTSMVPSMGLLDSMITTLNNDIADNYISSSNTNVVYKGSDGKISENIIPESIMRDSEIFITDMTTKKRYFDDQYLASNVVRTDSTTNTISDDIISDTFVKVADIGTKDEKTNTIMINEERIPESIARLTNIQNVYSTNTFAKMKENWTKYMNNCIIAVNEGPVENSASFVFKQSDTNALVLSIQKFVSNCIYTQFINGDTWPTDNDWRMIPVLDKNNLLTLPSNLYVTGTVYASNISTDCEARLSAVEKIANSFEIIDVETNE